MRKKLKGWNKRKAHKYGVNLLRLCSSKGIGMADRTRNGIPTIYAISEESGIPEPTLRNLYYGEDSPSMETLRRLGKYFGLPVGDLLVELTK